MIKIHASEPVRRWNAQIELADLALGTYAADEVTNPRKLLTLLSMTGHHELRGTVQAAGAEVGYWAPDGGPAPRTERPEPDAGLAADSRPVISADSTKSQEEHCSQTKPQSPWNEGQLLNALDLYLYPKANHRHMMRLVAAEHERDEMRTTLKQCRKALSLALCGTPGPEYFMEVKEAHGLSRVSVQTIEDGLAKNTTEIKNLATSALARINSIIPPSEV